jgi:hypothetical protein
MISDLVPAIQKIHSVNCLLFTDDVIFATGSHIPSINVTVNEALKMLEDWCSESKMTVNTEKPVAQLYTLSTKRQEINLKYKNQNIITEEAVKYLGIYLDKTLTWENMRKKWLGVLNYDSDY